MDIAEQIPNDCFVLLLGSKHVYTDLIMLAFLTKNLIKILQKNSIYEN